MRSIHQDVWRRGGVAATWELLGDGYTSHQLTAAVRSGDIIRARQGHYVTTTLSIDELMAVRVGGRLTGFSAARRLGLWTPRDIQLSVRTNAHARALRSPLDMTRRIRASEAQVRWRPELRLGTRTRVSVLDCLDDILRTEAPRMAFACLESAIKRGSITASEAARLATTFPRDVRALLATPSGRSDSGTESLMSFDLRLAGIRFRQQVKIRGVGNVDFVIGTRLVIEADGFEYHSSRADFEHDRHRDATLTALGYRVLRFSYQQLISNSPLVLPAIVAAMARGDAT